MTTTLEPYMIAQRLLEGQSYATISLIPFLVSKVRKGLEALGSVHEKLSQTDDFLDITHEKL
jgi:hypothetical protein